MNTEAFKAAYNASRNGCNEFYYHPRMRSFQYSDGVRDCAAAGCYWLLDILATELTRKMRAKREVSVGVTVNVEDSKATITANGSGDKRIWTRLVDYTDMPEGQWQFELVDEGSRFAFILLSEH